MYHRFSENLSLDVNLHFNGALLFNAYPECPRDSIPSLRISDPPDKGKIVLHTYIHISGHTVNALILPKVGSYGIKSFHYMYIGAKIWNFLPDQIQTTFSKTTFHVSPL